MAKLLTIVGILSVLFVLSAHLPNASAIGEEAILNFLEEFRQRMCHPIPKMGLPALDPFEIAYTDTAVNNEYLIDFTASLTNFTLTGVSDFKVNELVIAPSALLDSVINVTLPLTAFKSLYTAKGSLAWILMLAGEGDAEGYVKMVTVAISFKIAPFGKISISNLRIYFTIEELFVYFQTLFEEPRIDDFMHALVNELGLELLHDIWEAKHTVVEMYLEKKLNSILGNYTLNELVGIITGGSDDPYFGPDDPPADCKLATTTTATTTSTTAASLRELPKVPKIVH